MARRNGNGNAVNWMDLKHGDDVQLTVTAADQKYGVQGSASRCAIVQSIYRSNPEIRDVSVKEGEVYIRMPDKNGVEYRGRLIHSQASRGFAIQYDEDGPTDQPFDITLRMDVWREVKVRGPANKRAAALTVNTDTAPSPPTGEAPPPVVTPPVSPARAPRAPRVQRSRWDVSYFKRPASAAA